MPTIAEVRTKYPQYKDLSDQQLAEGLHNKYYSDMPFDAFAQKIGYQQPQAFPDTYGGAGGFNPMLPRIAGATNVLGRELGVTPESSASPMANAVGPLESVANAGTGLVGMIGGGLAGIGQGAWNLAVPKSLEGMPAADRVRQVQDAVTYQPRTATGAGFARAAGAPTEALGAATNYAGGKVTDVTGSPLAGATVKTIGDALPMVFGPKGSRGAAREGYVPKAERIPTREELGKAATDAYKRADDAGIAVSASSFDGMKTKLSDALSKDGIDADLHPNASAALKRVTNETGPVTLQKLETLRRIALDAEDTPVKADAKKAGDIVDHIDEYVDNLSDSELTSGQAKDAAALKEARALYTRKRKTEDIDRLIRRAEYSPSGFENGLRIEFRSLAKNDRRFNRFNAEEKAAIDKVAKGGVAENALRLLSKAAPTGIVSGGLSSGAGFAFGGPVGAVALPAAGIAGRMGAKALTERNARLASETMRRGPQSNGGLLSKESPTLPLGVAQAIVGRKTPRAPATTRSAAQVRAEIGQLSARAQFELATESAGSPKVQAFAEELARLQRELVATQANK